MNRVKSVYNSIPVFSIPINLSPYLRCCLRLHPHQYPNPPPHLRPPLHSKLYFRVPHLPYNQVLTGEPFMLARVTWPAPGRRYLSVDSKVQIGMDMCHGSSPNLHLVALMCNSRLSRPKIGLEIIYGGRPASGFTTWKRIKFSSGISLPAF
ncbi:hypothetical protein GYMLUDRAFT_878814 [Collybiopsis luxurians FD-317 M1]|uniref:Uncharacterized protein n=1 Tax=Collybiopsis luxurians FD-317 M1 TaxID=944289 RepID=A0A0D0CJM2_9AGAR|nr:hypothetical protein GYMLUDRAFT_878814 [Collybiopsis luxurians FD-317 M1]